METTNKNNKKILLEYLNYKRAIGSLEDTISHYERKLRTFFQNCTTDVSQITADYMHQWFRNNYACRNPFTFKNNVSIMNDFFQFCVENEYIARNPIRKYWVPRCTPSYPKYLSKNELCEVKMRAESMQLQHRVIIELFFACGFRIKELLQLKVQDINLDNRTVFIRDKGKKWRVVELPYELVFLLTRLLKEHTGNYEEVFLNKTGKPLSSSKVYKLFREIDRELKFEQKLTPRVARNTYIIQRLRSEKGLIPIQNEMCRLKINWWRNML
jgi:site-specific recombinase XerD